MKKFSILLLTAGFAVSGFGQSGRRIEPIPTPSPVTEAPTYSESIPNPNKPRRVFPAISRETQSSDPKTRPVLQPSPGTGATGAPEEGEIETIGTNLITIPVSVFDRNGLYIPNLEQKNFKIFEDGEEQEIAYFGTSEKPFTVVLLLDTSISTDYRIEEIQQAAIGFVDQLKPQDGVMVIEFDGNVNVLTEITNDRQAIHRGIRKADFGGGTSLYDAVTFSLARRLNGVTGRKAIVLFTDGVDTTSSKSYYDSTLALAEESEALIFPIYYDTFEKTHKDALWEIGPPPPGTTAKEYALGRKYLSELAAYTGGRVFKPEATEGGLTRAFEGIAEELRRQYNIGYVPKKDGVAGQRKTIKVRVDRPNLVIRARDSYIVGRKKK